MSTEKLTTGEQRSAELVNKVPRKEMTKVVRRLLDDNRSELVGSWNATVFGKSVGTGTIGICLVKGQAITANGSVSWSVVAKVLEIGAESDVFPFVSPEREINAYTSGLLDTLTGATSPKSRFRAAASFGLTSLDNNAVVLWLEDLSHLPSPPWDDKTFITVARHFGHFNGTWLNNPPEPQTWFHEDGYRERFSGSIAQMYSRVRELRGDAHIDIVATPTVLEGLDWIDSNLESLLGYLRTLERPLSHIDAQPKNVFPAITVTGEPETVAIDWATLGYAALGMDVANLIGSSLTWMEMSVERARELEKPIFDSYLEGLRDMGWDGDSKLVFLGYLCSSFGRAAGNAIFPVMFLESPEWPAARFEKMLERSAQELTEHWKDAFEWISPRLIAAADQVGVR